MKNILFIIYTYNAVSIRRFLILAKAMREASKNPVFLDLNGGLSEAISNIAMINNLGTAPKIVSFPAYTSESLHEQAKNMMAEIANVAEDNNTLAAELTYSKNPCSKLFSSLSIDPNIFLDLHVNNLMQQFLYEAIVAQEIFNEQQPDCIIYDIELVATTRAILYSAKQNSVPVVSMQHGEGNAEQYKQLPLLADAYIAYSPYNVEKLIEMRVSENKIFLTGSPDTDILQDYEKSSIAEELNRRYAIDIENQIVVISLKPNVGESFIRMNYLIIEAIRKIFDKNDKFQFVLRQHPTDLSSQVPTAMISQYYVNDALPMVVVPGDFPISKLFAISDYVITPLSFAIVEAVMLDNHVIVVKEDNPPIWPKWDRLDAFETVEIDRLTDSLEYIRTGLYASSHQNKKLNRASFVKYFRYKEDKLACARINKALDRVITTAAAF